MSQPNRSASLRRTGSLRAFFSAKARQTAAFDTVDQPVPPTQIHQSTEPFHPSIQRFSLQRRGSIKDILFRPTSTATPSAKLERKPTGMKKFMQMFKKDEDMSENVVVSCHLTGQTSLDTIATDVTPLPLPESQPESQTYVREELGQLLEEESVVAEAQTSEPKTDPDSDSLHSVDSAHDATSEPYQNLLSRRYSYTSLFGTIAQSTSIASSISAPNSKSDAEENSDSVSLTSSTLSQHSTPSESDNDTNQIPLIRSTSHRTIHNSSMLPIIAPSPTISFENTSSAPRRGSIPSIARVHLLSTYSEVLDDIDNILDSEDDILERFQEQQESGHSRRPSVTSTYVAYNTNRRPSASEVYLTYLLDGLNLKECDVYDTSSVVEEESEVDDEAGEMPVMKAVDMVDCVGPVTITVTHSGAAQAL